MVFLKQKMNKMKILKSIESKKLSKQISLAVEKAYLDLISQESVLDSLEEQLKASEAHYQAVSQEFKYGLSNSLDVMDANTLLIQSEREFADAQYNLKLADIKLKREKGLFLKELLVNNDNLPFDNTKR